MFFLIYHKDDLFFSKKTQLKIFSSTFLSKSSVLDVSQVSKNMFIAFHEEPEPHK